MKANRSNTLIASTIVIISALTFAAAVNVRYGTRGAFSGKHALIARVSKSVFRPGESIMLELTLSNQNAEEIYIIETSPIKDNRLEITKSTGEKVPLSEKGRKIIQSGEVRRIVSRIGPGEKLKYEISVGELYDLSDSGTYTVFVKRTILMRDKKKFIEVKSNPVTVTVGPSTLRDKAQEAVRVRRPQSKLNSSNA